MSWCNDCINKSFLDPKDGPPSALFSRAPPSYEHATSVTHDPFPIQNGSASFQNNAPIHVNPAFVPEEAPPSYEEAITRWSCTFWQSLNWILSIDADFIFKGFL